MLLLHSLAAAAGLNLLTVNGLSFDTPFEAAIDRPISTAKEFIITVQSTASISRAPDTVDVQLDISEPRILLGEDKNTLLEIESILARLRPGVDSWNITAVKQKDYQPFDMAPIADDEEEEELFLQSRRERCGGVSQRWPHQPTIRLSIRFTDTTLLPAFLDTIKPMSGVKVRSTSSDISDETRAEMKRELRRKVVVQAHEDGRDFAEAFDRCGGDALEFEQTFSYDHEKYDEHFFGFDDEIVESAPRPIEMVMEVRTKFSTQAKNGRSGRCNEW